MAKTQKGKLAMKQAKGFANSNRHGQGSWNVSWQNLRVARVKHQRESDAALVSALSVRAGHEPLHGFVDKAYVRGVAAHPSESADESFGGIEMLSQRQRLECRVPFPHVSRSSSVEELNQASSSPCKSRFSRNRFETL